MRKVVAFLIVGAFCITIFSPPALALKDNPKRPRPELYGGNTHSYGDDSGWGDPTQSGRHFPDDDYYRIVKFEKYTLYKILFNVLIDIIIPQDKNDIQSSSMPARNR